MKKIDRNNAEHHMMVAELLLSGKFEDAAELTYRESPDKINLRHFSEAYITIEDMIHTDDGMATGVTCLVGEVEWDSFLDTCDASAEEVQLVEEEEMVAILWENVYVIQEESVEGILMGYVDNHGDQHVVRCIFSS